MSDTRRGFSKIESVRDVYKGEGEELLRNMLLDVYTPEGVDIWLADAEKRGNPSRLLFEARRQSARPEDRGAVTTNTAANRQRSCDANADDLSPTCPHCGDLCDPRAIICAECGTRLYDRRPDFNEAKP